MEQASLADRVLSWSSYLTAEEKMHYDVINVDFVMVDYFWTREFKGFVEGLLRDAPSLLFLVGLQGSGKTNALRAIYSFMLGKGKGCFYWRWGEEDLRKWEGYLKECRFLLVDLPDYGADGGGRVRKDLDGIGSLWYESRYGVKYARRSIVVAVQKELFRAHYLLGKGEVFELRPLTPEEFLNYYFRKFRSLEPFDVHSFELVGRLSRGVFRRFMRYVRLCVLDMKERGVEAVGVGDVGRVIGPDVIGRDMDLELSGFLRGMERGLAAPIISTLMVEGDINQKDLAARLGASESTMSRLLGKLEYLGYVSRVHGERKELRVSIKKWYD